MLRRAVKHTGRWVPANAAAWAAGVAIAIVLVLLACVLRRYA